MTISSQISISRTALDVGGLGTIRFVNASIMDNPNAPAEVARDPHTSGHIQSFNMRLNRNFVNRITNKVIAHEFGHVIGLDDLGNLAHSSDAALTRSHARWNIMWYTDAPWVNTPSTRDRTGARLITGQLQCSHSFSSIYYPIKSTMNNGVVRNTHRQFCSTCQGWQTSASTLTCNVGSNGRCSTCNMFRSGDITRTGSIAMADALEIQKYIAGANSVINGPVPFYLADVNGDGNVNMTDFNAIMDFLSGRPSVVG